ncbi:MULTISPECIES: hypothetical protein [Phyllobacteriaceae]|uniref:Uncharacterized protein n=1 Tax=Mesorhizobium hungaricum TaxID=1566387 RepID=A0A1C2DRX9_9HYPH|nr:MULTISPECIES: hypothetical protein [Mesorhizobium]MBN9236107.1 hypothetical protein [Mesorhizobium sp.]MDQ0328067.1 hypothetical protein [Mesorhizobium sp. YL-MeA3-2017]OCX17538.1 hypothetical protein QV13_12315 [Mesorhizobium hungaricum]
MDNQENNNHQSEWPRGDEPWRRWLKRVVGSHGGPSAIARLAEIPLQTLKNYMNGTTLKPNLDYLRRIADSCAEPMDWLPEQGRADALPADFMPVNGDGSDVARYSGGTLTFGARPQTGRSRWRVMSRAIELAGFLPGDILEFSATKKPRDGEPVVAEIRNSDGDLATVLRIYKPPFLMMHTADLAVDMRPIPIEAEDIVVRLLGGFVMMLRYAVD